MSEYVTLPGSKRELLPDSRSIGSVDPTELVSITVRVRSQGNTADLERFVKEQANAKLADRKYLSHAELSAQQGASAADLDKVEELAQKHDLFVAHRSAAERSIVLRGKLGDALALFRADVHLYHHSTGTYRGRRNEITIPKELAGIVTGVFGFDTRPRRRRSARRALLSNAGAGNGQGLFATDFAKRYHFPEQAGGVPLDGAGQTIAIIELGGGYRRSDLRVFFQELGTTAPHVSSISVDHARNSPTNVDSADGEVMLDIEVAGAVVPKAKFAVYFGSADDKGFLDTISAAVHDSERKPSVISISWGSPESASDQQSIDAFHELFVQAAALGITVCAASGDHGTADLDASHWDGKIHVDHPAVDELVLGCGGTQVDNNKDVVWNDGTPFDNGRGGWAGGGGISQAVALPDYQKNANLPPSLVSGQPGRGVPDIAMSATNYFTRVDGEEGASGGTSAVAPLMAALVARLNQAKQKRVGFLTPFLYANAAKVMHDVTTGTNAIKNTVKGYEARAGWDACTGLGTPDGQKILDNL